MAVMRKPVPEAAGAPAMLIHARNALPAALLMPAAVARLLHALSYGVTPPRLAGKYEDETKTRLASFSAKIACA